jgi:hypothetical protein
MNRKQGWTRVLGDVGLAKFFLFDVLASTILGVVVWRITGDNVSSLLVSLVMASIFLVVELRFQLAITKEDLATLVGFQREALKDDFLLSITRQIVEGYERILTIGDDFFLDRAQDLLSECAADITKLRTGYMEVEREETLYLMSRIKGAKRSVFATSFVKAIGFWKSGGGREYFQENLKAIGRGVRITRVFIVENEGELTEEVAELIGAQVEGGVDTKIAFARNLSADLLHDFAIFDEEYVHYLDLIPGSREMRGARFYRDEAEVRRVTVYRDRILREAEDAPEVLQRTFSDS